MDSYLYLVHSDHRPMRGGSATGNSTTSSITSPLRSFSTIASPRSSTPSNKDVATPVSPGISSFSTITINRNNSNSSGTGNGGDGDENGEALSRSGSSDGRMDPNEEIAALSNKLIKAINHQTMLDDSLTSTRHELELSKARIKQLEQLAMEHEQMMAKGLLVDRKDMETEHEQFMKKLKDERNQRSKAERDKKTIEQELEHLTTALFEEANKMVEAARRERDAMDRKNEQLRAQLADTESLLASHQEQLAELKLVMQQLSAEKDEHQPELNFSIPSSPTLENRASKESLGRMFDSVSLSPSYSNQSNSDELIAPSYATSFTHLVVPVLRHDTAAYQDFLTLLRTPKAHAHPMVTAAVANTGAGGYRLSGGALTSFNVIGMGMGVTMSGMTFTPNHSPTTSSVSNNISPSSPSTPGLPSVALKETRFYKRVLIEDIEPTLRLDLTPGLSWLAKRNTISAITDGTLLIDPLSLSTTTAATTNGSKPNSLHLTPCTLCGESRNTDPIYVRSHCMRTSETDNAQRYPLCGYCVNRVRATCDFLGFLRMCKEGLWKCESEQDEKHAWEVCTGHRERMFWGRVGGGVVPASAGQLYQGYYQGNGFGGRNSLEGVSPRKVSGMSQGAGSVGQTSRTATPAPPSPPPKTPEPRINLLVNKSRTTPPPPVAPPKKSATAPVQEMKPAETRKDPSLSPLRRIWTLGTSRVLGDRSVNSSPINTAAPATASKLGPPIKVEESVTPTVTAATGNGATAMLDATDMATKLQGTVSEGEDSPATENKENIPQESERPKTPTPLQRMNTSSSDIPETPASLQSSLRVVPGNDDDDDVMDSPSSTRAVYRRDREDSLAGSVLIAHMQKAVEVAEETRRELELEMLQEQEEERRKEEEEEEKRKSMDMEKGEEKVESEVVLEEPKRTVSPTLPGGWD